MRHWLSRGLGMLAIAAILTTAATWVFSQTVGNPEYLKRKAAEVNLSQGLSSGLPEVIAAGTGAKPAEIAALAQILTPSFIDNQLLTMLPQLVDHYRKGDPAPQFDPAIINAQAAALGVTLPPELAAQLPATQPVVQPGAADITLQGVTQQADQLQWLAPLVAVVCIVLILVLGGHHRWTMLAGTAAGSAISVLILSLLAKIPPSLITSTLHTSPAKPLTEPIRRYAEAIAADQVQQLLWIAGGLGAAAVIFVIIHVVVRILHRAGHHAKPKPGTPGAVPPGH